MTHDPVRPPPRRAWEFRKPAANDNEEQVPGAVACAVPTRDYLLTERQLKDRKLWEGPSTPRKVETLYHVCHVRTGTPVSKAHPDRLTALIEAFELGLVVRARGEMWLSQFYEIKETQL